MKNDRRFLMIATILALFAISFTSCTKEGPKGKDGENGIDGKDGTASCVMCHDDSQVIFAKSNQWEASVHAKGGNFERNDAGCAPCHTSQGFLERMANGTQETADKISNPNPPNCYTCHNIHSTYTVDDWNLTYADPVNLWEAPGETIDLGKGNLCANCHQARVINPFPVAGTDDIYTITSSRYGPHHGPMANILSGIGGYENGDDYPNSMHTTLVGDACVTCHMGDPFGAQAGGHQMGITYIYHEAEEFNLSGCASCHDDEDELITKIEDTQTEINGLLAELKTVLMDAQILGEDDLVLGDNGSSASSSNPASLTADEAGAVINYQMVREDRSSGVHNYNYTRALLENSIASLRKD